MEPTNYDWSQFTLSIPVQSSMALVYDAFATQKGMETWFLRHCGFQSTAGEIRGDSVPASVTDRYHFRWWGWPDDMEEFGEILQANGLNHFEFTFTANEMNDMKVEVRLSEEAEFVRVTLHQYDIPVTEKGKCYFHLGCTKGWTFYLSNLKSILEGGLDLRNKDENVKRVINS